MSLPYPVTSSGIDYTVVDDARFLYRVVAAGRVFRQFHDEVPAALQVRTSLEGLDVRVLEDGFWAVSGYTEYLFPHFGLAPYSFDVEFSSAGYRPAHANVSLPAGVTLPVIVPDLRLQQDPIRIQGRVVEKLPNGAAIPGAAISVDAAGVLVLRTPAVFDHPAGASVVESQMAPVGAARTIALSAVAGSSVIEVSDRSGIASGDILRLGSDVSGEYVVVDSLPTVPGVPDRVVLRSPLMRSMPTGAAAQQMTHTPGAANAQLAEPSFAGAGALLLNAAMAGIDAVEVSSSAGIEYHDLRVISDAQGFYRWDGVAQLDSFDFRVTAPAFADLVLPWIVNYSQPVNIVNFRMLP